MVRVSDVKHEVKYTRQFRLDFAESIELLPQFKKFHVNFRNRMNLIISHFRSSALNCYDSNEWRLRLQVLKTLSNTRQCTRFRAALFYHAVQESGDLLRIGHVLYAACKHSCSRMFISLKFQGHPNSSSSVRQ